MVLQWLPQSPTVEITDDGHYEKEVYTEAGIETFFSENNDPPA